MTVLAQRDRACNRESLGEPGASKAGQRVHARGTRRHRNEKSGILGKLVGRERTRIERGSAPGKTAQERVETLGRHKLHLSVTGARADKNGRFWHSSRPDGQSGHLLQQVEKARCGDDRLAEFIR